MECEVTAKTYEQLEVTPGAVRVAGDMELNQQTLGFYMDALTTAMIAEHAMGAAQPMTLITGAERVKVTKAAGQTWTAGQWIYWDSGAQNFTNIPASDLLCVGKAQRDAGNAAVIGFIVLQDNYHPIQLGTSLNPIALATGRVFDIHVTHSGAGNVEPFVLETILSTLGATGGRALFKLSTEIQLGGWANALKAQIDFGATGHVLGLGSAFCAELVLPTTPPIAGMGNYVPLEAEIVAPAGCSVASGVSFISCGLAGLGSGAVDDDGFLMDINVGAIENGHIFNEHGDDAATGGLRIRVNGATNWLLVSNVAPA